jgi:tripartite-type tricarboxylate transporter receptor subunit TctC
MLFMNMTGVKMQHVPFKGSAPALLDLLANRVQVMFDNLPSSISHIKAGKLRALAVTTAVPSADLPGVPTVGETVPGYEASAFFGLVAPKGTPPEIVARINKLVNDALKDPAILKKVKEYGGIPMAGSPEEFGKVLASETDKWGKVVHAANLSIE